MPELPGETRNEGYFNDLAQQPASNPTDVTGEGRRSQDRRGHNEQVPKPKRIACLLCRRRKLKCDGTKPSCRTCTRLQHDCSYDEVRKKSGPKRGYVKALEARLAQVETMLKTQDVQPAAQRHARAKARYDVAQNAQSNMVAEYAMASSNTNLATQTQHSVAQHEYPHFLKGIATTGEPPMPSEEPFPWEVIGLGLDEPLPNQDVVNELNQAYFDKVHPSLPMIHRPRYYAAMNLALHMKPPVCLRYAMWANAAAVTDKYEALQDHFYQCTRKYIQQDEMKGHGESMITVSHCQTWLLLAIHEFKLMYFPRAWMSSGRASRMAQMMGLHRLDGSGLDVKQCLPPPKDWTEREERRRTFWMSFCVDRYSSIGTGWPMSIEEADILTNLPTDEKSFEASRPAKTMTLFEALEPAGTPNLSSFAGVTVMACLFGRNLTHLHRPSPDDEDHEFWERHREMDNILLNTALALPDALRLPLGLNNPNTIFMNMNLHTSTICLHQAAIFKADKNRMPARISAESKVRCITAAAEIASIMRQISHLDLAAMNPFISFCLYVAARVFVQYLKTRSKDDQVRASLQFLLSAMHAIKRKNPLTESFLVQLDVDLEGAGLGHSSQPRAQMRKNKSEAKPSSGCSTGHLGMNDQRSTYGDNGIAAFNQPTAVRETRGYGLVPDLTHDNNNNNTSQAHAPQYDLPNRQRQPTPTNNLGTYHSPNNGFVAEMDTSPDGSGNQKTPGYTSTQSQHYGSSLYSPQNQQAHLNGVQIDPSQMAAMDSDLPSFTAPSADAHQPGFVIPQAWAGSGSTGMTPGAMNGGISSAGLIELMNDMTDDVWNSMLESLTGNGWETGMDAPSGLETMGRPM